MKYRGILGVVVVIAKQSALLMKIYLHNLGRKVQGEVTLKSFIQMISQTPQLPSSVSVVSDVSHLSKETHRYLE